MKYLLIFILIPLWVSAEPSFEKEIAPILETHCISCHNDEKTKGKLNLSSLEKVLTHKKAVKPGDSDKSLLIEVISGDEPEMPPKGEPLSKIQISLLKRWIDSGAKWPKNRVLVFNPTKDFNWWSLEPMQVALPVLKEHPVDYFINKQLLKKGLLANKKASSEVLIRRITYDLSGLPPTPNEISTFKKKYSKDPVKAWEEKVDELLNKKSFGEKWAQHWLDLARYADTHGYDKDKLRLNAWPYRDYVIRSLNEDKPYDQFIQEQIAGDVIYPNTEDGIIGLGFLAAGPWDYVGHAEVSEDKTDGKIARHMDRDEMVAATFNIFMSTTVQCAQCHHHKFDPIHQEDYYRVQAAFSAIDRADRVYSGLSLEQEKSKNKVQASLNKFTIEERNINKGIKKKIIAKTSTLKKRENELKAQLGEPLQKQYGYHSKISKAADEVKWVQVDLGSLLNIEEIKLMPAYDNFNDIGAGFGFPVRYKIEVSSDTKMTKDLRLIYKSKEDEENPRLKTLTFNVGGAPVRSIRVTALKLRERTNDFIFAIGELKALGGVHLENLALNKKVLAKDTIQSLPRWSTQNLTDEIYHKYPSNKITEELLILQGKIDEIVNQINTPARKKHLSEVRRKKSALQKKLATFPQAKIVYAASTNFISQIHFKATNGKNRPIHFLNRGDISSPGAIMKPGAPQLWKSCQDKFIKSKDWDEGQARRKLAEYLTDKENPLVWRSITNRLWQWTFGSGIVGSPNDFGRMGMKPTNQPLLDFLAVRLKNDPQHSFKSILRLLLTSETYQRSSSFNTNNAKIDSSNKYLWKFNRRRLTAEEFRDSLLFVGGKLKKDNGGPGFRDFNVSKPNHSPHYEYHLHNLNDTASHRRSVYRFVVRSQPQPMLTTLDCADPSLSVPKRDESTTALQALAQWNNKFTEVMSVYFAEIHEKNKSSIEELCLNTLGRVPSQKEKIILEKQFKENGLASVARILFNMNGFTYVD